MSYYLRTTDRGGKAHGGFQWPREIGAVVTAPDWVATDKCGNGLHGLLNGLGDEGHLSFEANALWWIVEADNAINLLGKHKFETCRVINFGTRRAITTQMNDLVPGAIHGLTVWAGDKGTATVGYHGTATAGDNSTATAGAKGTATVGYYSTATAGYGGKATAGYGGTATAGDHGTATAGYYSQLTARYYGADAMDRYYSTATAGYHGKATVGYGGTATAGDNGVLVFERWLLGRERLLVAYVGEDGILPNVAYRASEDFKTVVAHKENNR